MNPTLLMALTPRSCTPSWCNVNSISKTVLAHSRKIMQK
ncbi:hypothetical protein ID866_13174 [Astraeus odoratus]|nr:hypothetical protein ID866_13174 [Astraeus odoratus]